MNDKHQKIFDALYNALVALHAEMVRYRWDTEGAPTSTYRKTMQDAEAAMEQAEPYRSANAQRRKSDA